jgi:hypothetical protein
MGCTSAEALAHDNIRAIGGNSSSNTATILDGQRTDAAIGTSHDKLTTSCSPGPIWIKVSTYRKIPD